MAAPKLSVVRDDDGGASLVAVVDGISVKFATVNPSQLEELRVTQGVAEPEPDGNDDEGDEG